MFSISAGRDEDAKTAIPPPPFSSQFQGHWGAALGEVERTREPYQTRLSLLSLAERGRIPPRSGLELNPGLQKPLDSRRRERCAGRPLYTSSKRWEISIA